MPEGDTVAWTAARLHRALAGRQVTRCDLRWPSLATVDLAGSTTLEVRAVGKHLLHRFDSGVTLHSHLRMEGTWRVRPATEPVSRHHLIRAIVGTGQSNAIGRALGMLDLVPTEEESRLVGHLGPDILAADWSPTAVLDTLARDARPVADTLLDQRVLAGLGTFWVSESLYAARLHPWHPAAGIPGDVVAAVLEWARRRMLVAARTGVQSATGHSQRDSLGAVHARSGLLCRRCGTGIRVALAGPPTRQRTIFYCPACQGGLAPTDDGRPQAPLGATSAGRPQRPRH